MKQILQNLANGETLLAEVPCPQNKSGHLLISSRQSLVSAGTERMLVEFGKASYIDKARQQPDKVKQVLTKVKTDGLLPTVEAVRSKLDQPLPLGYCNAGVVLDSSVAGFEPGDRVVSNGSHAEVVRVAKNLCAKIPDNVDDESAAFTVLASIGLQGVRLLNPTLGETVVVSGLGLVGLLCVQILRANGCRVLGIDFDSTRCELAKQFGAEVVNLSAGEDPVSAARRYSRGRGVDGVVIAAATQSDELMHQAADMCRKRGRIVLVGVVGLNLRRDDFFKKEITFQVSASYGPGRYDTDYEDKGLDYPVGFVRWTEQRNFEAVLDMMSMGLMDIKPLITHRYAFDDALEAYRQLDNRQAIGILLQYPTQEGTVDKSTVVKMKATLDSYKPSDVVCGFLGAGNYASRVLIPRFNEAGAKLDTLVTSGGVSAFHQGNKHAFAAIATESEALFSNDAINTVAIVTQHNLHARQVIEALESGKHVFVEKPLALTLEELSQIQQTYNEIEGEKPRVMVGFNRRFSPHIVKMKALLQIVSEPKSFIMTINAGAIPKEHWTQDIEIGGGRIIGEGCHFIDLLRFLAGYSIVRHSAVRMGQAPGIEVLDDKVSICLEFEDGSFGTIHYLANGGKEFPKERLEVFCNDAVLQMDNFRSMKGYGWKGFNKLKLMSQDKGQKDCVKAFVNAIENGKPSPITFEELVEVSKVTIEIAQSLR